MRFFAFFTSFVLILFLAVPSLAPVSATAAPKAAKKPAHTKNRGTKAVSAHSKAAPKTAAKPSKPAPKTAPAPKKPAIPAKPAKTEAPKAQAAASPASVAAKDTEGYEKCNRNAYFEADLKTKAKGKVVPVSHTHCPGGVPDPVALISQAGRRVEKQTDVPRACTRASLDSPTADGLDYRRCTNVEKGEMVTKYSSCSGKHCGLDHPCLSRAYHDVIHESLVAAGKCTGVDPMEVLPVFNHESRLQLNAVSNGPAWGPAQLRPSAVIDVNDRTAFLTDLLDRPECQSLRAALDPPVVPPSNAKKKATGKKKGAEMRLSTRDKKLAELRDKYKPKTKDQFGCSLINPKLGAQRSFVYGMLNYQIGKQKAKECMNYWKEVHLHLSASDEETFEKLLAYTMYNGGIGEIPSQLAAFVPLDGNSDTNPVTFVDTFAEHLKTNYGTGVLESKEAELQKRKVPKAKQDKILSKLENYYEDRRPEVSSYLHKILCETVELEKIAGTACSVPLVPKWKEQNCRVNTAGLSGRSHRWSLADLFEPAAQAASTYLSDVRPVLDRISRATAAAQTISSVLGLQSSLNELQKQFRTLPPELARNANARLAFYRVRTALDNLRAIGFTAQSCGNYQERIYSDFNPHVDLNAEDEDDHEIATALPAELEALIGFLDVVCRASP